VPGRAWRAIIAPFKSCIHHASERREWRGIAFRIVHRIVPTQIARDRFRVRIQQNLARIEAMAPLRIMRAMHAIPVNLTGLHVRQTTVPDLIRFLRQGDAL
jgi:hypothetical protein